MSSLNMGKNHRRIEDMFGVEFEGLNALCELALRTAEEHGFTEATPSEDIALMHSELSEALEDIRAGHPLDQMMYKHSLMADTDGEKVAGHAITSKFEDGLTIGKPIGVPSEMADIIVRVLHFCGKHKIDLRKAVREKMQYNDARPYKHGGKKF